MRSFSSIVARLILLVKPMIGWMILAILLGTLGNVVAMMIPTLGFVGIARVLNYDLFSGLTLSTITILLVVLGVSRGIFRYGEQVSNHYIAFKVLARIRHQLFVKLQELAPAKLDQKNKGDLISTITSDVELLEVFYAHTISPFAIAFLISIIMGSLLFLVHPALALWAIVSYAWIALGIPMVKSKQHHKVGNTLRERIGGINTFFLDNLRGLLNIIQFQQGPKRIKLLVSKTKEIEEDYKELRIQEGFNRALTDASLLVASTIMMVLVVRLASVNLMDSRLALIAFGLFTSSFGPFVALSMLSNNLYQTMASANRVLDVLDEEPELMDITNQPKAEPGDIQAKDLSFGYEKELVLEGINLSFAAQRITGVFGKSGSGKSTLIKLMQRFHQPTKGAITLAKRDVQTINTSDLRDFLGYMQSNTDLFNQSIMDNIRVGRLDASDEEVIEASKKASLHHFVETLPHGYNTHVGELGSLLSDGEKQRIGLARLFVSKTAVWLLDEPTSNLDSLNEAVILHSLHQEKKDKTIVVVSHRPSTLSNVEHIHKMSTDRKS